MKKFDDKEKDLDRSVNRIYVEFRKYNFEETCPFCTTLLHLLQKFSMFENWKHDQKDCFEAMVTLIHSEKSEDKLRKIIDNSLKVLSRWQEKENERK